MSDTVFLCHAGTGEKNTRDSSLAVFTSNARNSDELQRYRSRESTESIELLRCLIGIVSIFHDWVDQTGLAYKSEPSSDTREEIPTFEGVISIGPLESTLSEISVSAIDP